VLHREAGSDPVLLAFLVPPNVGVAEGLELSAASLRRLRMQDLGRRAVISRTRASRVVDELVAAGYVSREPNPDDKRSSFATMTEDGRKVFRRAAPCG